MMITAQNIEDTARPVAQAEGFELNLLGTRLNGNGLTTFLWQFKKHGKTYHMEDEVSLRNVSYQQLPQWSFVFRSDMDAMEEM